MQQAHRTRQRHVPAVQHQHFAPHRAQIQQVIAGGDAPAVDIRLFWRKMGVIGDRDTAIAQSLRQRLESDAGIQMRLGLIKKRIGKAASKSGFKLRDAVRTDPRVARCAGGEPIKFRPVAGWGHDQCAAPHHAGYPRRPPVGG
ncbi:MAG: hypothetical protein ACD_54C00314G0001, partial [uncultured bacterium]